MFDPVTARLLQTAPPLKDLDPNDLPAILTQQYAELVARRLRGSEVGEVEEVSEPGASKTRAAACVAAVPPSPIRSINAAAAETSSGPRLFS